MQAEANQANGSKRVLVVEDDTDVRALVAAELEDRGYVVSQAQNGLEALESVADEIPNVILLDMRMPIMDGWHFVIELRKRYGRGVAPIVVMTAAPDARERAREVGADGWLAKPFELDDIVAVVARAIR